LSIELFHKLFDVGIMVTIGIMYPHYWLGEEVANQNFLTYLNQIKVACVLTRKSKVVTVALGPLDSRQLNVQVIGFSYSSRIIMLKQ
jgi:hypothetical protein